MLRSNRRRLGVAAAARVEEAVNGQLLVDFSDAAAADAPAVVQQRGRDRQIEETTSGPSHGSEPCHAMGAMDELIHQTTNDHMGTDPWDPSDSEGPPAVPPSAIQTQ